MNKVSENTQKTTNIETAEADPLYAAYKRDSKIVKGRFTCHEPKGGYLRFAYKKYPQESVKHYELKDGEVYELPLGVVKHLNNCVREEHSNLLGPDGKYYVGIGKKTNRFTFQSLEYS